MFPMCQLYHHADELLGGYKPLCNHDQQRLWERNLGRDDRILSDHGVEVRLPFLDPHVVHYCQDHLRAEHLLVMDADQNHNHNNDPAPPHLPGDKRVLRRVAQRLGLTTAAAAPKRAIQFGSRVAHVSDKRRFGSRRQATGRRPVANNSNHRDTQDDDASVQKD